MMWRELWSRLKGSFRRDDALEREMQREMEFHLEMATQRNQRRGLTAQAAQRQAKLAFGSAEAIKEEAREAHRALQVERVIADVLYALRSLRRSPAFTIAAVLSLALGIGASTAIFTVVNGVLLRPLPIPEPNDFRYIGWAWAKSGSIPALTDFQYEFVRDHSKTFDAVAAYRTQEAPFGDEADAPLMHGLKVTNGFFPVVGIKPRLGRAFDSTELATSAPVVILSDATWRTRLGGDSTLVGRTIRLDGELRTVIGVLPPEFNFPPAPKYSDYVVPLAIRANPNDEGLNTEVIGRLRSGTSKAVRAADLSALSKTFDDAYPALAEGGSFRLFTHVEVNVGSVLQRTLWLMFGAIGLVLLIACANTATLLLVRATARQREIAVRASIGASPLRIVQQLLTEGLVLSSIATVLGIAVGIASLRGFLAVAPGALPSNAHLGIDARVLVFAAGISVVTGVAFGLAAAVPAYRARIQSVLLGGAQGGTTNSVRIRHALVFFQTAVTVVLLAGAALLTTSFARLIRVDPGFDANRTLAVRLGRLPLDYDAARRELLVNRLLERVGALPGVEHVALAPSLPLERGRNFVVDTPEHPELGTGAIEMRFVSPAYLVTLGIPLRSGREFNDHDLPGAEPVAIVNEAFARRFWKEAPAVGQTIQIGHLGDRWLIPEAGRHATRVVGVAADIHEMGLDRPAKPTVLVPRSQGGDGTPLLLVRGESRALVSVLREAILAEEPRLKPVVEGLSHVVSRSIAAPRFRTMLVGSFATFALLLSGIGIYGVIASGVQHRRREIALRLALGASGTAVATAVARRCLANVGAGVLVGLLVFWTMRRLLTSWLFDMTPGDPRVLGSVVVVLALVAALASWIPTRRATQVDPASTLRLD